MDIIIAPHSLFNYSHIIIIIGLLRDGCVACYQVC